MSSLGVNLENYLIPLSEINCATENCSQQRCIGSGGFGAVYKGQLSERWQNRMVAIKRLGQDSYQGEREFRNELEILSRFHHENIISFIGYCDEDKEMILVYDYARNGSLDYHLRDANKMRNITWTQRLKICLGAARGLNYLHSGLEEHSRVIHRDVKSANILLDENFVAKICDFGLSKLSSKNMPDEEPITKVAGTKYYVDPAYQESHILKKESDVYSFGVVMFEMLSGMLVYNKKTTEDDKQEILMTCIRRHDKNELFKLIDPIIRVQIPVRSFDTFKEIAYECIRIDSKDRPAMEKVIERIEEALNIQENDGPIIECVMEDMGFSYGKPVAAVTIYKCLLNWNYVEAEYATVFDQLIQIFNTAEEDKDNNDKMAYWLSNASTLLFLIKQSLELNDASSIPEPPPTTSRLGRLKNGLRHRLVSYVDLADDTPEVKLVRKLKGNHTVFLFKQQLTSCVINIYNIICDNLKKDLGSLLALCIQAPQKSIGNDSQFNQWQCIVDFLDTLLSTLKKNFVPSLLVQKLLIHIFSYINMLLLNSILRQKCCSWTSVQYVNDCLYQLQWWCALARKEHTNPAWEKLWPTKWATAFLHLHPYRTISSDEIANHVLGRLSKDGRVGELVVDANINTFMLNDSSRIPFNVDDLSTSLQEKDFSKVEPFVDVETYGACHLKMGRKHIMFGRF